MVNIHICNTIQKNKDLEKFILEFIKISNNKIIGIDFEFNRIKDKREVALCQINFEYNKKSDIYLFYPPNINKNIFNKLLITKNIIKIIHGGESLDIPYLFENIIPKKDRLKFCKNLYDTRYMCEYYNNTEYIDGKCKIYDLLLQMKVINKNIYDDLIKNDKMMGNIWEIHVDVNNMSPMLVKYCVGDVLYLPALYRSFPSSDIYKNILQQITCINFILRFNGELDKLYTDISSYNLKKHTEYNVLYNDIYITVFNWIILDPLFDNLYKINYFKKFIEVLIKNILYHTLDNMIILYRFDFIDKKIINKIENEINKLV